MSRDGYLPDDVDYGDLPGYDGPDDPPCDCGHPDSEHNGPGTACLHVDGVGDDSEICTCQGFTPVGAY